MNDPNIQTKNTRIGYKKGTCKHLKESPYICFIFVDDNESQWDNESIDSFWYNQVEEAMRYIEKWSKKYNHDIEIEKGVYTSNDVHLKYEGTITKDITSEEAPHDLFIQIARLLGYDSKKEMHHYLKKVLNKNQIAYAFVVNKKGRSFAMDYTQKDNDDFVEYCILFNEDFSCDKKCYSATIVHEILHLFGAEDYYDPYGLKPKRKMMADLIYPYDIMNTLYYDIEINQIGAYTAYTIGWLDTLPRECNCTDWWE